MHRDRLAFLGLLTALVVAAVFLFVPPVPQDPAYHDLADDRVILGIPRFGDVVSNFAFVLVGIAGMAALHRRRARQPDCPDAATMPLAVFFGGLALVGPASAYYHWNPTTPTLFWDRLPMAVAFMALLAAVIADRVPGRWAARSGLAVLVALGVASVVYWSVGEAGGAGDLRFYGMVQFFATALVPLIFWLFPRREAVIEGRAIATAFVLYALAKSAEAFDQEIFAVVGGSISGHSMKHLLAAAAAFPLVQSVMRRGARSVPPASAARHGSGNR